MKVSDLLIGVAVGLLLVGSFFLGRICAPKGPEIAPEPQVDTVYLRDTITVSKPVYLTRYILDTLYYPVPGETDTLWVPLPREQVEWRDTLSTVWASGVDVAVDSVRHYVTQTVVTIREPYPVKDSRRWGIGVTAGYGVTSQGLSPFVGVGVSWTPWRW